MLPIITECAPATMALDRSPEKRIPPSAITGTPVSLSASTTLAIAVICGTPVPVTMRVVQIEPGPIPTFYAVGPGFNQGHSRCTGGDVTPDNLHIGIALLNQPDPLDHVF